MNAIARPHLALLALVLLGVGTARAQQPEQHPLLPAIELAEQSRASASQLNDYQAIFTKRELVRGQVFASQIQMKFRRQPFAVYLHFVNPEHAGREAMFVEGQYDNKLLAHETGFKSIVGTVAIDPNGQTALAEARHPISLIGIEQMAAGVIEQWKEETAFGEIEVKYYAEAKLGEQPVIVIESIHPVPRRQFPYAITRLWIDKTTRLPVRVQQYEFPATPGSPPVLAEEYTYTNLRPNVGLTDIDFDRRNPAYSF